LGDVEMLIRLLFNIKSQKQAKASYLKKKDLTQKKNIERNNMQFTIIMACHFFPTRTRNARVH
jgi:hypothetical protein